MDYDGVEGEVADRLQRPASGSIAVTALEQILRIDGRQQLRTGSVHQCIFERRYAFVTVDALRSAVADRNEAYPQFFIAGHDGEYSV